MLDSYDVGGTATVGVFVSAMVLSAQLTTTISGDVSECLNGDDEIAVVRAAPSDVSNAYDRMRDDNHRFSLLAPAIEDRAPIIDVVAKLKDHSGLTVAEVGRAVGVSRRSVHNWAAGRAVSPVHEERLRSLYAAIFPVDSSSNTASNPDILSAYIGESSRVERQSGYRGHQRIQYSVPIEDRS